MAWPTTSRHERGYGTAHDKMRAMLMRTIVSCEECTRQGRTVLGTIADHIVPLSKGGSSARTNYQLLCKDCSDAKTLADKGQSTKRRVRGVDENGWPNDPNHHWNRK